MSEQETKSPARVYGESVIDKIAAKYIAGRLAKIIADSNVGMDEDITTGKSDGHKAVMLDAGNLLHLKLLFDENFPHRDSVFAAVIPPVFDTDKLDDCIKAGPEGEVKRKHARMTIHVGVRLLDEMIRVYTHELSHLKAAEHFGAEGEVAVVVMPEMRQLDGDDAYGIALNLTGGRCRISKDFEMTPEKRAVIAVAGHMGEKLCTSIKGMGEEPARDVDYWLRMFKEIYEAGDPDKAENKGKDKAAYHSGAYYDAANFFECAPTEEAQHAAIETAGEIIIAQWADVLAAAAFRSIKHLTAMGDVMTLMTTAMDLAEAASMGNFGEVKVVTIAKNEGEDE